MVERLKSIKLEAILISLILIAATAVRVWNIDYDLPYIYHPDEPIFLNISQNIFKYGDFNPHFFTYGSLFFYINYLAYIPFFLVGKLFGAFEVPADILSPISLTMGVTEAQMPGAVLFSRLVTVAFAVGTVGLTYVIGKRLKGQSLTGLIAALMLAFGPTNVLLGQSVTPDTFVTFFACATFLASLLVYQSGKTRYYILAGVMVGFTLSSKYNAVLILLTFLAAHFFRYGKAGFRKQKLYLAIAISGFAFLATTPYSVLDFPNFWIAIQDIRLHYSTGHPGMEGDPLRFYLNFMWTTVGLISIFAGLEVLRGIFTRSKEIILLSIFPVTYFFFIISFNIRNDRTFLPVTPFLFLLAASFLVYLLQRAIDLQPGKARKLPIGVAVALVAVSIAWPVSKSIDTGIERTERDSREISRIWIANNIPPDSQIAIEPYSPYVDPDRFKVQGVRRIIEHKPSWYIENGFDYLVFSSRYFGRFYRDPEQYASQVNQYNPFFDQFNLVERFTDQTHEVLIYAVN